MGNFYTNITLRGPERTEIADLLQELHINAFVSPTVNDFTVVYEEISDKQDEGKLAYLAENLSKEFKCLAFAVLNHDDDYLIYGLYNNGTSADQYNSELNDKILAEVGPDGVNSVEFTGDEEALCSAFGAPYKLDIIRELLQRPSDDDLSLAIARHNALVTELKLPPFSVGLGYNYISNNDEAMAEYDLTIDDFIKVEGRQFSHEPDLEAEELLPELAELIVPASKLVLRPINLLNFQITSSHFGGNAYAEAGEEWPICSLCDEPLEFICQLNYQSGYHEKTPEIGLLSLFYCLECRPTEGSEGWEARVYGEPSPTEAIELTHPDESRRQVTFTGVQFAPLQLMPDWSELELWSETNIPPLLYFSLRERLKRDVQFLEWGPEVGPFIGKYPQWPTENEATPTCPQCDFAMDLLIQISENGQRELKWLQGASIYLFYCDDHPEEAQLVVESKREENHEEHEV